MYLHIIPFYQSIYYCEDSRVLEIFPVGQGRDIPFQRSTDRGCTDHPSTPQLESGTEYRAELR